MPAIRLCKIALVGSCALYLLLVALNNVIDYSSNFSFVRHVMSMVDTFSGNKLMGRAIRAPWVHHLSYGLIIVWEALAGATCLLGAARALRALRAAPDEFARSQAMAAVGLTAGLLLWLLAFLVVGGEWFVMWQSQQWNGQDAAARSFAVMGVVLILWLLPERV